MNVYLDEGFYAKPDTELLGYMGELGTRRVVFNALWLDGADSFSCLLEYEDGVTIEVSVENSYFTVTEQVLRHTGKVRCQVAAKAHITGTQTCRLVKKSNIFTLVIKPSLTEPAQRQASDTQGGSLLDDIRQAVNGLDSASDSTAEVISGVIADAIERDIADDEQPCASV